MSLLNNETFEKKQTLEDFLKEYNENKEKIKDNFKTNVFVFDDYAEELKKKKQLKKIEDLKKWLKENQKSLVIKKVDYDTYDLITFDLIRYNKWKKIIKAMEELGLAKNISLDKGPNGLSIDDKIMEVASRLADKMDSSKELSDTDIKQAIRETDIDERGSLNDAKDINNDGYISLDEKLNKLDEKYMDDLKADNYRQTYDKEYRDKVMAQRLETEKANEELINNRRKYNNEED